MCGYLKVLIWKRKIEISVSVKPVTALAVGPHSEGEGIVWSRWSCGHRRGGSSRVLP